MEFFRCNFCFQIEPALKAIPTFGMDNVCSAPLYYSCLIKNIKFAENFKTTKPTYET